jgi:hypothetical protein
MVSIVKTALTDFPQTNLIVKDGKDLLMSGQLNLTDLDGAGVAIECLILKKKRQFNQSVEGNVNTFPSYVMAETSVSPAIESQDLLITQDGKKFIVGAVSIRHDNTGIQDLLNEAAYLYADLELYSED